MLELGLREWEVRAQGRDRQSPLTELAGVNLVVFYTGCWLISYVYCLEEMVRQCFACKFHGK